MLQARAHRRRRERDAGRASPRTARRARRSSSARSSARGVRTASSASSASSRSATRRGTCAPRRGWASRSSASAAAVARRSSRRRGRGARARRLRRPRGVRARAAGSSRTRAACRLTPAWLRAPRPSGARSRVIPALARRSGSTPRVSWDPRRAPTLGVGSLHRSSSRAPARTEVVHVVLASQPYRRPRRRRREHGLARVARPSPQSCETLRVSRASTPLASSATLPALSGDGRYVAFLSSASNLVADDTNGVADVFSVGRDDADDRARQRELDRRAGDVGVGRAERRSMRVGLLADARYVAFDCVDGALDPASLAPTATWSDPYLYVRDRRTRHDDALRLRPLSRLERGLDTSSCSCRARSSSTSATSRRARSPTRASPTEARRCRMRPAPRTGTWVVPSSTASISPRTAASSRSTRTPPSSSRRPTTRGGVAVRDLVLATTTALGDGDFFFPVVVADDGTVVAAEFPAAGGSLVAYAPPAYAPSALDAGALRRRRICGSRRASRPTVATSRVREHGPERVGARRERFDRGRARLVHRTTGAVPLEPERLERAGNAASVGASIPPTTERASRSRARRRTSSRATARPRRRSSCARASTRRACSSGDGTATPCPCGNSGASGHGCASSSNAAGARLVANGVASAFADTLSLASSGTTNGVVLFVQSTEAQNGGLGVPLGDGVLVPAAPLPPARHDAGERRPVAVPERRTGVDLSCAARFRPAAASRASTKRATATPRASARPTRSTCRTRSRSSGSPELDGAVDPGRSGLRGQRGPIGRRDAVVRDPFVRTRAGGRSARGALRVGSDSRAGAARAAPENPSGRPRSGRLLRGHGSPHAPALLARCVVLAPLLASAVLVAVRRAAHATLEAGELALTHPAGTTARSRPARGSRPRAPSTPPRPGPRPRSARGAS